MTTELSHRLVARELRVRLDQGEFDGGRQLPTEAELAEEFQVSRQTVRRAFQDLVAEGRVERSRGRGTFARAAGQGYIRQVGSIEDLINLSDDTVMQVLSPLTRKVDLVAASRLLLPTDVVYELAVARSHHDVRFCLTRVFLPPKIAALLEHVDELRSGTTSTVTVIGLLDELMPRGIGQAQQSITVDSLGAAQAEHLHCEAGKPTLRIDRLYLDTEGEAVELTTSHFLPEHYSYRVQLQRGG